MKVEGLSAEFKIAQLVKFAPPTTTAGHYKNLAAFARNGFNIQ
jgi:hypothetical protein